MAKRKIEVKIEQTQINIGRVFRVAYHDAKTGKLINYLKNESCHVTRDPKEALVKINRKDAESNGRWCAGRKPGWPRGKRQKAYAYFLDHGHYPPGYKHPRTKK